jgi:epoxyqueuosine reductase
VADPVAVAELRRLALDHGLDAFGVAPALPLRRARHILEERKQSGLHGDMAFTYRNPLRSTDPDRIVRGARSMVVGARRYPADPPPADGLVARVARYAWSDHYADLRTGLRAVASELKARGWRAVVVADDNALVDREAAWLAGLGWYGKNANLLLPGQGSWFVLGAVVTDCPLPPDRSPVADGCGACRRCLDACPTGAIVAPGVVDARRCLAWLAQAPGVFPPEHRAALADRLYGCDDCQEVCPPNRRPAASRVAPASEAADARPGADAVAWVDVLDLLDADDATLLARHGRWYLANREPRWLRRNALIVLGNRGDATDPAVERALRTYLGHPDPILRAHAAWAADRLGRADLVALVVGDASPEVRDELARRLERAGAVATRP